MYTIDLAKTSQSLILFWRLSIFGDIYEQARCSELSRGTAGIRASAIRSGETQFSGGIPGFSTPVSSIGTGMYVKPKMLTVIEFEPTLSNLSIPVIKIVTTGKMHSLPG